jgi:precorrin-3B C17-methyltransferase
MTGWLAVCGLGPGDAGLVTPEVSAALRAATDVVGYGPYVARADAPQAVAHASDNRLEGTRAALALRLACEGRRVAVVSSGDPGVFAMAAAVFEAAEAHLGADAGPLPEIRVLPGVTAMLAAAARAGAPLGHDFCAINLSDNLKPFETVLRRVRLAVAADFAIALYNPRSAARPHQFGAVLDLLRQDCAPDRLITFARAVATPQERVVTVTLAEAEPAMADMRTLVIVGSSATRRVGPWVYTPRRA